jgi:hypothetical protein
MLLPVGEYRSGPAGVGGDIDVIDVDQEAGVNTRVFYGVAPWATEKDPKGGD